MDGCGTGRGDEQLGEGGVGSIKRGSWLGAGKGGTSTRALVSKESGNENVRQHQSSTAVRQRVREGPQQQNRIYSESVHCTGSRGPE